jgi:ABC-type Co2+ transport system permease subunit
MTVDYNEVFTRIVKYLLEGLTVGIVAYVLPSKSLSFEEILLLALTAAAIFAIMDLLAPAIGVGARQGVGLGAGFNLMGFP